MPEYLTPGVYVEETSFRSRSIEGVPTSTFGMAGVTEYGPVPYVLPLDGGKVEVVPPAIPAATLVTSFTEYERAFGGLSIAGEPCQVALAARAFFGNGGHRLYVARVFDFVKDPAPAGGGDGPISDSKNFASLGLPIPPPSSPGAAPAANAPTKVLQWRTRWPGSVGAQIKVSVRYRRSKNVLIQGTLNGTLKGTLKGVREGAAVEIGTLDQNGPVSIPDTTAPGPKNIRIVTRRADETYGYDPTSADPVGDVDPKTSAFHITLDVTVTLGDRIDVYAGLELGDKASRSIFRVLKAEDPADELSLVWLHAVPVVPPGAPAGAGPQPAAPGDLLNALVSMPQDGAYLVGGSDGDAPSAALINGGTADADDLLMPGRGLGALEEIDDLAIVATPGSVDLAADDQLTAANNLIDHCQKMRYRMGIVDPPQDSSVAAVRRFRSQFDSTYAALYYPWLRVVDPILKPDPGMPTPLLDVPPSGSVAGIYARSDIERGVHKAPANEVILGITNFVTNVTYDRQAVLNPEGVNALRFFTGRANRVWGARTMSSDPEWRYVNVRRLFIYLEHSIDKSTQWAVFEPNNERLWGSIKQTIEDFLITVWRTGALMGTKPEEAFFVRCDRTTMTQNDLDNGRLICLIGVAPTYPAEFVIFRIGQWTADSQPS